MSLSRNPQHLPNQTQSWYYEEKSGIEIHHDIRDNEEQLIKHVTIKIPWRKLKTTMCRYRAERLKVVKR